MTTSIPIPKLHSSGAVHSETKECKWWPEPEGVAKAIEEIENPRGDRHRRDEHQRLQVGELNGRWVDAAQRFLTYYVSPTERRNSTRGVGIDGIMSAALTRIRDDNVVQNSISGLDEGTLAGLNLSHRDVLAAVALLSRLDRTTGHASFRPESFEAPDTPDAK